MTSQEPQWEVKLVQQRYQYLDLTYEQAELIYEFEQEKDTYSEKYFFSAWEEWDYELSTFRQILNPEQLTKYENSLRENIMRYERELIQQDQEKANEIAYQEELSNFYEMQILPEFFKDPFLLYFGWLHTDKAKIDYLKSEYNRYLNESKKAILTSHFRHNRTFKPNELKIALLRHKRSYIWPDYSLFKQGMDSATKAVAIYLASKLKYLPEKLEKFLTGKFEEIKTFNQTIFSKYYGDPRGWHVVIGQLAPEEEREHRAMTALLLDEKSTAVNNQD